MPRPVRRIPLILVALLLSVVPPAAAAPVNTSPPELGWWLGEGVPLGNTCSGGSWFPAAGLFRFTWVLDPGAGEQVLGSQTAVHAATRTSTPQQVNHRIGCRVEASDDGGTTWSAPVGAQADPGATLVPPLVKVTVNGTQVSGDVGGNLTGAATVQVRLRRDAGDGTPREVDVSPVVNINATDGTWTAALPQRAVAEDRDTLVVDYTGPSAVAGSDTSSGVPPDMTMRLDVLSSVRVWVSPGGTELRVLVPECGQAGACPRAIAHQTPLGDVLGISDNPDPFATSELAMDLSGGPITDQDPVTAELFGRFWGEGGQLRPATLSITKAAPMRGVGDLGALRDANSAQEARVAPSCVVLRYDVRFDGPAVGCTRVGDGAAVQLLHRRGATVLQSFDITGSGGTLTQQLGSAPQTGDVVTLRMAAAPQRVLAEVTVAPLRLDMQEKQADGWAGGVGGVCAPGRWLGTSLAGGGADYVCGPGGTPAGEQLDEFASRELLGTDAIVLLDDHAGGGTAVAPPSPTGVVPADGAATWGATWTAFGDVDVAAFPWSGFGPALIFSFRPRTDPLSTAPFTTVGNANTVSGVPVSGVAPGRYEGRWVVTDANGDTRAKSTFFFQQPLVPGLPGATGASGATGAAGPAGPAGGVSAAATTERLVLVSYQQRITSRRVSVRYALTSQAKVTLTVVPPKGRSVTVAKADGRVGRNVIAWNRRLSGRRAKPGTYRLRVTATAGRQSATSTVRVRLR